MKKIIRIMNTPARWFNNRYLSTASPFNWSIDILILAFIAFSEGRHPDPVGITLLILLTIVNIRINLRLIPTTSKGS